MTMLGQGARSIPDDHTAELCISVPASAAAGPALRRAVRALEGYFGPQRAEDVELLLTELVTNGVKHAAGERDNRITVDARVQEEHLHVSVRDRGPGFTPRRRSPERSEPGGWGLMLVEDIADRWGVEREPTTTVWFELGSDALAA